MLVRLSHFARVSMLTRIAWMVIGTVTFDCCTLNAFWCVIALFHLKQNTAHFLYSQHTVCLLPNFSFRRFPFFAFQLVFVVIVVVVNGWVLLCDDRTIRMFVHIARAIFLFLLFSYLFHFHQMLACFLLLLLYLCSNQTSLFVCISNIASNVFWSITEFLKKKLSLLSVCLDSFVICSIFLIHLFAVQKLLFVNKYLMFHVSSDWTLEVQIEQSES